MSQSKPEPWDIQKENQKAIFTEHMYKCSGRTNGLFTGLWEEFCLKEAGPACRDQFFDRLKAIKHFHELEMQQKQVTMSKESFVPTLHD